MSNITNLEQVGVPNVKINPYTRNANSGSQELKETLVMKDLQMSDFPDMMLMAMMGPINTISRDENDLGYTVYFFGAVYGNQQQIKTYRSNLYMKQ